MVSVSGSTSADEVVSLKNVELEQDATAADATRYDFGS